MGPRQPDADGLGRGLGLGLRGTGIFFDWEVVLVLGRVLKAPTCLLFLFFFSI
jgi:hypothetical protein